MSELKYSWNVHITVVSASLESRSYAIECENLIHATRWVLSFRPIPGFEIEKCEIVKVASLF